MSYAYDPPCPTGFVIPDEPSNPDTIYVNRTLSDCAVSCQYPNYTFAEWEYFDDIVQYTLYVGIVMISVTTLVSFADNSRRGEHLTRMICCVSLIENINDLVFFSFPWSERICRNNANILDASDGFSICAVDAVVSLSTGIMVQLCWVFQAAVVFTKVVLERKQFRTNSSLLIVSSVVLSAVPAIALITTGSFGAMHGSSRCFFSRRGYAIHFDKVFWAQFFTLMVIGIALMAAVVAKVVVVLNPFRCRPQVAPGSTYLHNQKMSPHKTEALDAIRDANTPFNVRRIGEDSDGGSVPDDLVEPDLYSASRLPLFPIHEDILSSEVESSSHDSSHLHSSAEEASEMEPMSSKATGADTTSTDYCADTVISGGVAGGGSSTRVELELELPPLYMYRHDGRPPIRGLLHAVDKAPQPRSPMLEDISSCSWGSGMSSDEYTVDAPSTLQAQLANFESGTLLWGADAKVGVDDNVSNDSTSRSLSRGSTRSGRAVSVDSAIQRARAKQSILDKLRLLFIPLCYVAFYACNWGAILFQVVYSIIHGEEWQGSFVAWSQCAVKHYRGTDESWQSLCGAHPPLRMSVEMKATFNVFFAGQGVFTSLLFLPFVWSYLLQQYKLLLGYEALNNMNGVAV